MSSLRAQFIFLVSGIFACGLAWTENTPRDALTVRSSFQDAPSVWILGFNSHRSGVLRSTLADVDWRKGRWLKQDFAEGVGALKFMPLFINGKEESIPFLGKHRILLFFRKGFLRPLAEVVAYDLDSKKQLWSLNVPRGPPSSSITVNRKSGFGYFLATLNAKRPEKTLNLLNEFALDGGKLRQIEIPIQTLLKKNHADAVDIENVQKKIRCKTSINLNQSVAEPFLVWGCSLATAPEQDDLKYGRIRGASGLVVRTSLESLEKALPSVPDFFSFVVSKAQKSLPDTGFDGGIYNIGGGPTLLSNASVLVATGNGIFNPEKESYGCSVVQLDSKLRLNLESPEVLSINEPNYDECWPLNNEFASSSVAVDDDDSMAAVHSKDGSLWIFNPKSLRREKVARREIGGTPSYGQPVVFSRDSRGQSLIVSVGKKVSSSAWTDQFLTDRPRSKKSPCVGWLAKESQSGDDPALVLYYSGPQRDDFANVVSGSDLEQEITSYTSKTLGVQSEEDWFRPFLFAPYKRERALGYLVKNNDPGLTSIPLPLLKQSFRMAAGEFGKKQTEEGHFLSGKRKMNQKMCEKAPDGFKPIYLESRFIIAKKGHGVRVQAFSASEEGDRLEATKAWSVNLAPRGFLANTHSILGITSPQTQKKLNLVSFYDVDPKRGPRAYFAILDAKNGRVLSKQEFLGQQHFSMPLVVNREVFIPTKEHGIQWFGWRGP